MSQKPSEDKLLTGNVTKLFLRYLAPSVLATLLIAANYLIDSICVGLKLGESALAALNVVVPVTGLMYAAGFLFAFGSSNLFSNYLGHGSEKRAKEYYGTAVIALALFSLFVTVFGLIFNLQISWLLCAGAPFYTLTAEYLRYVFLFAPFYCFETFYTVYMRNDGTPAFSMFGTISTCSTNIILDILFIWVFEWDMMGASLATGLGLVVGFFAMFSGTCRKESKLKLWQLRVNWRLLKEICINGAADFLREISGSLVVLIINVILLELSGETAVSAYGVIASLGNVVLCGLAGVSNAMQPLVSYNIGGGQQKRAQVLLRLALITSSLLSMAYVIYAELNPQQLVSFFLEQPTQQLIALCDNGIRVISPSYILAGLAIVFNVYYEAVHAPTAAFTVATMRGLVLPVGSIVVCVMIWGLEGVWLSFLLTEVLGLFISVIYYPKVKKQIAETYDLFSEN